jgi:hypothetical protein
VTTATGATSAPGERATPVRPWTRRIRYGWVVEALRARAAGAGRVALDNAKGLVDVERALGLYQEHRIQQAFLDWPWFMSLWNVYYGTIHFVVPVVALVTMWRRDPERYARWRNVLLVMLGLGLVAFWAWPLMPPRLMPPHYDFVDAAAEFFNFGPQQRVVLHDGVPDAASRAAFGNLFAAMPSLHVGWATWSTLALLPIVRTAWVRVLLIAYPFVTTFAIVVTANHWILDAVGGWLALGIAWLLVVAWERARGRPPLRTPAQA